jgi:hypothetical protein
MAAYILSSRIAGEIGQNLGPCMEKGYSAKACATASAYNRVTQEILGTAGSSLVAGGVAAMAVPGGSVLGATSVGAGMVMNGTRNVAGRAVESAVLYAMEGSPATATAQVPVKSEEVHTHTHTNIHEHTHDHMHFHTHNHKHSHTHKEIRNETFQIFADLTETLELQNASERRAALQTLQHSLHSLHGTSVQLGFQDLGKVLGIGGHLVGAAQGYEMLNAAQGLSLANFAGTVGMVTSAVSIASSLFGSKDNGLGAALQGLATLISQGFTTVLTRLDALEQTLNDRMDTMENKLDQQHYETYRGLLKLRENNQTFLTLAKHEFRRAEERAEILRYDVASLKSTLSACQEQITDSLASLRHEGLERLVSEITYDIGNQRLTEEKAHQYLARIEGMIQTVALNPHITGKAKSVNQVPAGDPTGYLGLYATEPVAHPSVLSVLRKLMGVLNGLLPSVSEHNIAMLETLNAEAEKLKHVVFRNPVVSVELQEIQELELKVLSERQNELLAAVNAYTKRKQTIVAQDLQHILTQSSFFGAYTEHAHQCIYQKQPSWITDISEHCSEMSGLTMYEELTAPGTQIHTLVHTVVNPCLTQEEIQEIQTYSAKHLETYGIKITQPMMKSFIGMTIGTPTATDVCTALNEMRKDPLHLQTTVKSKLPEYLKTIAETPTLCLKIHYGKAKLCVPVRCSADMLLTLGKVGLYVWHTWNVQDNEYSIHVKHVISGVKKTLYTQCLTHKYVSATTIPLSDTEHAYQAFFGLPEWTVATWHTYIKAYVPSGFLPNLEIGHGPIPLCAEIPLATFVPGLCDNISYTGYLIPDSQQAYTTNLTSELQQHIRDTHVPLKKMMEARDLWLAHESMLEKVRNAVAAKN